MFKHRTIRPKKEPTMSTPNITPTAVAYFVVNVPYSRHDTSSVEDAERVINAYLYSGAEIVHTVTNTDVFDAEYFEVLVRVETYSVNALNDLTYRVDYQRGRFSSGMYGTTDPTFLS